MITFIVGFVVGGCGAMLILGLLSLTIRNERKHVIDDPIIEPMKFTSPESYQELRALIRDLDNARSIRTEKQAFL
jgi:hypothetical protein